MFVSTWAFAAGPDGTGVDLSRRDLVRTVSDALSAFHSGTALLRSNPEQATAAFRQARDGFQTAVDAGIENGKLYYNLGNTHLRLGEVGEAIACYRRAQRLAPRDERLKANLRFARSLRRDRIEESGERALWHTVFAWHYALAWRTRFLGALGAYGAFWLLMIARTMLLPRAGAWGSDKGAMSSRLRLGYPAAALLLFALALGASAAVDWSWNNEPTEGVLVAKNVVVRKGNGEGYDPQFAEPLHEGVEFTIVEQRGGWVHIELGNGQRGWIRADQSDLF